MHFQDKKYLYYFIYSAIVIFGCTLAVCNVVMLIYFLHLNTQTGLSIRFSKLVSIVKGPPLELRQTRRRTRGGFTLKGAVFNPREAFKSSRGKVTHCVHNPRRHQPAAQWGNPEDGAHLHPDRVDQWKCGPSLQEDSGGKWHPSHGKTEHDKRWINGGDQGEVCTRVLRNRFHVHGVRRAQPV